MAESLSDFSSRCETELEIPQNSITGFDCRTGSILPTTQFGAACDAQALLGGVGCIENSRLGVMSFSNADVKGVWVCRKYTSFDNADDSRYHDIAMIIHNRKNGKTCFFQNKLDSTPIDVVPVVPGAGPDVPGPKDSNALSVWRFPQDTAAISCTSCHSNDPFIVTPHVAEALSLNSLIHFNPKGLYSVVGDDFTNFNTQISRTEGCSGLCHFVPSSRTNMIQDALSRHWMVPGLIKDYTPYNFNPINGQFYTLRSSGEIRGFNGSGGGACNNGVCLHWSVLDANPDTAEIAASGHKLYQRHNTGLVWEFTGVQCSQFDFCPGWQLIANDSRTIQLVAGGSSLYMFQQSGAIWKYTGTPCNSTGCPGWQLVDNNAATIEIVASGDNLYQRHKSGAVWKYTGTPCSENSCPGWQLIANDSRTIQLVADGSSLYMFQQSGAIWKYTGTPCNSTGCPGWQLVDFDNANTKQVVAGSENLYRLYKDGEIWRYTGTGQSWEQLDNNPNTAEISASVNGLLQRHTSGVVWWFTGTVCSNGSCPGWTPIQNFANTIAVTGARQ
jgi:hypothetical protein